MIKAIQTKYNRRFFRSRLEARWAVFFDALGIQYEHEPEGYDLGSAQYLPDFWLPTFNFDGLFCEVKPLGSHFPKAEQFALITGFSIWLCCGPPDFAIYKCLTTSTTEPNRVEVICGTPNAWNAHGENRMFSFPCGDKCLNDGMSCNNYQPIALDESDFKCSPGYTDAIEKALSARFEHNEGDPMAAGIKTHPAPYCPECGAQMKLRRPKSGQDWRPFWGCSRYPGCKGNRNIDPETGEAESDEVDA